MFERMVVQYMCEHICEQCMVLELKLEALTDARGWPSNSVEASSKKRYQRWIDREEILINKHSKCLFF